MPPLLTHLPDAWRTLADQQRRFGAEAQARILEYCADEVWSVLRADQDELLSLRQAAAESGYSVEHLGRLIREGKLPNAGRKAKPLIRRQALPIRPRNPDQAEDADPPDVGYIQEGLFRDIATSKYGD